MSDDQLTWEKYGSPCIDEGYLDRSGVQVDPWNFDQCAECEYCGSCIAHLCYSSDNSALLHMDWFKDFASPDETECGHIGGPANLVPTIYQPRPCNLAVGHDGAHRALMGWSWQTSPSKGDQVT